VEKKRPECVPHKCAKKLVEVKMGKKLGAVAEQLGEVWSAPSRWADHSVFDHS
jgi:hypothetical protein